MEMSTGGAVRYAGFWVRFAASVIDSVLVSAIVGPLLVVAYGRGYFQPYIDFLRGSQVDLLTRLLAFDDAMQQPMYSGTAGNLIQYLLPSLAIVVFWMARQATPGKMVFRIRIADATTLQPPSAKQDIGRYLAYFVSIVVLGLGFLAVAFDKRKQGWHDRLAGTVVIYG
jgi:uncharacterized RDD family membrane protein YckC